MIRLIGNTLLALVAAVMVADPVMACCLSSTTTRDHAVTQSESSLKESVLSERVSPVSSNETAPPCHGAQQAIAVAVKSPTQEPSTDCPSCEAIDCGLLLTASATEPLTQTWLEAQDLETPSVGSSRLSNALTRALQVDSPPYRPPLIAAATPVSLHQRLLN